MPEKAFYLVVAFSGLADTVQKGPAKKNPEMDVHQPRGTHAVSQPKTTSLCFPASNLSAGEAGES